MLNNRKNENYQFLQCDYTDLFVFSITFKILNFSKSVTLTSPLGDERVDVHEGGEDLMGLTEPRLVPVQGDHHGALKSGVRETTLTSRDQGAVLAVVEN